ncbi:MAG: HAD family hydrolase [Alkalispirochaetaceae bacterium]
MKPIEGVIFDMDGKLLDAVVSVDEVPRGKPEPDVFLEAARRIDADPRRCIVLEDSSPGIAGALAAGMGVVALPSSEATRRDGNLRKALLIYSRGAEALEVEEVLRLIDGEEHDLEAG